ncbi:conserved hypothetical protein [Paraburkholderia unamae]|uniref:hypothetical protein n=1 Tax=Paraburkholderia unamae TaxID=219649 RepID=UPI001CAC3F9A|nr:hypothetical protein [Paraburkholderia unamae]CAG9255160.1 conserved hypothetical protein [Paraburkholderia unamae]
MSGKIEMTVTINSLVSPLLFEKLSGCATPRERAILLRALAEAAIRRDLLGGGSTIASDLGHRPAGIAAPTQQAGLAHSQPTAQETFANRSALSVESTTNKNPDEGFQTLRVADSVDTAPGFGDDLGSQLAGFFE